MKRGDLVRPNPLRPALRQKGWRGVIIKVFPTDARGATDVVVYSDDEVVHCDTRLIEVVQLEKIGATNEAR